MWNTAVQNNEVKIHFLTYIFNTEHNTQLSSLWKMAYFKKNSLDINEMTENNSHLNLLTKKNIQNLFLNAFYLMAQHT